MKDRILDLAHFRDHGVVKGNAVQKTVPADGPLHKLVIYDLSANVERLFCVGYLLAHRIAGNFREDTLASR
jgi:hypothetical protein